MMQAEGFEGLDESESERQARGLISQARPPSENVKHSNSWILPEELREYDASFLTDLVMCFLEDADDRLRILRQAASSSDLVTLSKQFHALRGSAHSLGATEVAGLCGQAEEHARAGLNIEYSVAIASIGGLIEQVRPIMAGYCDSLACSSENADQQRT